MTVLATVLALTALLRCLGRVGLIDVPNHRSSHDQPVPRGGGLGCLIGVAVGLATAQAGGRPVPWHLAMVAAALAMVGLADDFRSLPAVPRLAAQVTGGAVAGAVIGGGWWVLLAGVFVVPVAVNAVNFMDGIDGLTGMVMSLWGLVAVTLGTAYHSGRLMVLGTVAAGAALGFLPFNLPRARLFLGDVGSYLFGSLAGVGLLLGWRDGIPMLPLVSPLAVHLIDTGVTGLRRVANGQSLSSPHRDHVYQRLVSTAGLSHRTVAVIVLAMAAGFTLSVAYLPAILTGLTIPLLTLLYISGPRLAGSRTQHAIDTHIGRTHVS